jgi:ankyrin repeat protein/mono/diheme cytochrome c family protein
MKDPLLSRRQGLLLTVAALATLVGRPASAVVDFARDVQPLFEKHCYECHGPKKQQNGFRLDRRSRAMAGVLRPVIIAGNSPSSRLYRRIVDSTSGQQMPPEDVLSAEEVATVRQWIDEGAHWPDGLANEVDAPPPDPAALALIRQLRISRGDAARQAVRDAIARNPAVIDARGPDGATPLMYAALYADAELLRDMLAAGGNPNKTAGSGASALMWAIEDHDKVALLLDAGADVNATSAFGRTALSLATISPHNSATAELLLARGAKPTPMALGFAAISNESTVRKLLAAGAKDKGDAAGGALLAACIPCFDVLRPLNASLPRALLNVSPPAGAGHPLQVRKALESGADVNARDPKARTPLIMLSISQNVTPDLMQALIDRGADVHSKSIQGLNALDYALRLGRQPVIDVLTRAGAQPTPAATTPTRFVADNSVRAAVARSLPLLQTSSQKFYQGGGCVACHHNLQAAITVTEARRAGIAVDESLASEELSTLVRDIDATREQALEGMVAPGGLATTTGYILLALDEQKYRPDESTDALARLLRLMQRADGRWPTPFRPPIEASEFTATAVSARGLRRYGGDNPTATSAALLRATHWLESATPLDHEDRVFRLLGLVWLDGSKAVRKQALRELFDTQRRDGGWSQTEYRSSDAYATGEALYALRAAGVSTDSRAYRRGVRYLLRTQLDDGSWWVRTRALPTQNHFESGFPHGADQFISAAATHWATQALLLTLPDAPGNKKVAAR